MQLLTVASAAKKLEITRQRLYKLIKDGRIPSTEIDGMIFIDMDTRSKWTWSKSEEKTNT